MAKPVVHHAPWCQRLIDSTLLDHRILDLRHYPEDARTEQQRKDANLVNSIRCDRCGQVIEVAAGGRLCKECLCDIRERDRRLTPEVGWYIELLAKCGRVPTLPTE